MTRRGRLERLRRWLAEHDEDVPPCPRCGSPEVCYSDSDYPVAPWNMD